MQSHARRLFGAAAAFNFAVALALLFLRSQLGPILKMDPVSGTNLVLANATGAFVAVFGWAYWRVANDPAKYRVYIPLAIIGKLSVVAGAAVPFAMRAIDWRLPSLTAADLVFALLFWRFLRKTENPEIDSKRILN